MPQKHCPVCKRIVDYPRGEWQYVSKLPSAVCSVLCVLTWILQSGSAAGYLKDAVRADYMGVPDFSYSGLLGRNFRSDFERRVAEWFYRENIDFEYEPWGFPVKGSSLWVPDFHLPKYGSFIEVKGIWGSGAHSKITDFQNRYPEVALLVVPWTLSTGFHP
jgi:hypothetical protein